MPSSPSAESPGPSAVGLRLSAATLLVACRIPYLTSPDYVLDGDEAILGVMARHVVDGAAPPVFFYGQSYGFSLVETLAGAGALAVIPDGALALSLAMLGLFLVGMGFWERTFHALSRDPRWSVVLALALGLLPVWIVWSTKARGGYLTAFAAAGAVAWLLTRRRFGPGGAVVAGILAGVVAQAQPLWLPGLLPLFALPLLGSPPGDRSAGTGRNGPASGAGSEAGPLTGNALGGALRRGAVLVALALLVAVGTVLLVGLAGGQRPGGWEPGGLLTFRPLDLLRVPELLFTLYTGFFLLGDVFTPPMVVAAVALVATILVFGVFLLTGWALIRDRSRARALVVLSPLACLLPVMVLDPLPPRYLLPITVFAFLPMADAIGRRPRPMDAREIRALGALLLVLVVAAVETRHLRTHAHTSDEDVEEGLRTLVETLEVNGVEAVYVLDGLLQWQMAFYGEERLPVRSRRSPDRYPAYGARVDSIFTAGGRVALVAPAGLSPLLATPELAPALRAVGTDYVVLPDPHTLHLELLGFHLPEGVRGPGAAERARRTGASPDPSIPPGEAAAEGGNSSRRPP